jgi:outer membrane lipoprotein-sorting protein
MVVGLLLSSASARAEDVASADEVLERMAAAYGSVKSLGAQLQQVKSYPQLGMEDPPEKGVLSVKRKAKDNLLVRLEIQHPEHRIVTVNNGQYMLYQPRINQAIEGRVDTKASNSSGTSFMSYFMGDLSGAKKDYDIEVVGDEQVGQHQTVHLRLTAKPEGQGYYPRIDLWVDQKLWIPVRQELVEPNRSVTTLEFADIRVNGEMKDSLFKIKLPAGVERVKG